MRTIAGLFLALLAAPLAAETTTYRVLFAGDDTGHLIVDTAENRVAIDFDYKQNGRGPTIAEEITLDERGFPTDWSITGTTTFGSPVDEFFRAEDGIARWRRGEADLNTIAAIVGDRGAFSDTTNCVVKGIGNQDAIEILAQWRRSRYFGADQVALNKVATACTDNQNALSVIS